MKQYKPDGYLDLTNSTGIEIRLNKSNDGLSYWYNNAGHVGEPKDAGILYDDEGNPYFMAGEIQYHLNEFLKV